MGPQAVGAKVFHPGLGNGTVTGHDGQNVKVRFNAGGERSFGAKHGSGAGRLEKHAEPSRPEAKPKARASEPKPAPPAATPKAVPASQDYPKMTPKQAEKWGSDNWPSTSPPLPANQRQALREYASGGYKDYNGYLRTGKPKATASDKKDIAAIDAALRDHPTPSKATVVHRGIDLNAFGGVTPDKLVGKNIHEPGYLSTSVGKEVAGGFAHHDAHVEIKVPVGTPAFYMDNLTGFKGERELLLARGLQYKILSAKKNRAGKWQVQAEIVPVAKKLAGDAAGIELAVLSSGPSAVAQQVYRKLRAKGVKHAQALAMAKRAASMRAKATAKAA